MYTLRSTRPTLPATVGNRGPFSGPGIRITLVLKRGMHPSPRRHFLHVVAGDASSLVTRARCSANYRVLICFSQEKSNVPDRALEAADRVDHPPLAPCAPPRA